MTIRPLIALLALALPAPAADIVLLLETGAAMDPVLASTRMPAIPAGDRVAIMTFAGKPRLRQAFTANWVALDGTLRRLSAGRMHIGAIASRPGIPAEAPVFNANGAACRLFEPGSSRRAVIVLFGSEDYSPAGEAARTVSLAHASLYAVAVRKMGPPPAGGKARTPPTLPSRAPGSSGMRPLPEATFGTLADLARASGGATASEKLDLAGLFARIGR